jgi:hydroxyacylglutathione hydrolase
MVQRMILEMAPVGPLGTNAYVVGCAETHDGAIVDPGDEGRRLVLLAQTLGLQITKVLITHGHVDHVGGVGEVKKLTGATVWMHHADLPLYQSCVAQARMFGIEASDPPPLDEHLSDGQVVSIGKLEARVIATPGHSPGGVSFYFASEGVLLSGDTLFQSGIGRTDLPGGSMKELMRGIHHKLLTLPDDTRVLCGHGPPTTVRVEKRSNPFVKEFPP